MTKFFSGLLAVGVCCATLLTGCAADTGEDTMSITFCGRIEAIEENSITLQPGQWEEGEFVPNENASPITLQRDSVENADVQCAEGDELQEGTVIRFTVSAGMSGEEKTTRLEILQQPS